jgi:hypothetical protein
MPKGDTLERSNQATRRLYDSKFPDNLHFRGVDGEGGNVPEDGALFGNRHQYLSLRVGPNLLETGAPLSWWECFAFLADQSPRYIYVAYFFDYDVTMMIRTLPEAVARKLLNRSSRANQYGNIMPVKYSDYEFDYMAHKEFRIRRAGSKHWVIISDVGQFFQKTFLNTITKWDVGTPEEREVIRKGKEMRADFAEHSAEIEYYNTLECVLLEQLMTNFRAVCWETGYVPRKWQGPGFLASAMLERHGVPRRDDIPILNNSKFRALAQAAYYGGRFETTAAGPITGPIYQYDINGAYVYLLKSLPCLTHGSWRRVHERPDRGLYFGEVYFNHDAPRYLYNLPVRLKNGNIQFPKEGNGVYWSVEIDAAERCGTHVAFNGGWLYESNCDCRWFDFVDSYYAERLKLGKSTKGYVLKLAGNSCYGKLAQSIGYAPYANPVWAGIITASCRSMLIDAYRMSPDKCYMLATDGLFMGEQLPNLSISKNLGEWELTTHEDGIFIVQPGVYFAGPEPKSRGVEVGRITEMRSAFQAQWEKYIKSNGVDHTVSVEVTNFITAKQALSRNKWRIAGTWEKTTRGISFDWSIKRKRGVAFNRGGILRTVPHDGSSTLQSVPYGRNIGGGIRVEAEERYNDPGLLEANRMSEQPDWVQPLL